MLSQANEQNDIGKAGKLSQSPLRTNGVRKQGNLIKSPSDTTVYAPAFAVRNDGTRRISDQSGQKQVEQVVDQQVDARAISNQVSDFVESIRNEQQRRQSEVSVPGQAEANDRAEKIILEAEKFRDKVATLSGIVHDTYNITGVGDVGIAMENLMVNKAIEHGNETPVTVPVGGVGSTQGFSDDDFFHLICHVD